MNIICILAGGKGNRFGSAIPKQYHLINGRPVIEYVINAAIKSSADEVVIVSDPDRAEEITNKYGIIAIEGGTNRNRSIGKALNYIKDHYSCDNIILIDAVCPMIKADLFDLYFTLLEDRDAVFTASELTTSLSGKDGSAVDRRDFILIESPDAYRFDILYDNFDPESRYTTPLHMLPADSDIKYYYDFSDYIKITLPHDLAVAEALMRERDKRVRFESHSEDTVLNFLTKLRIIDRVGTRKWEKELDDLIDKLFKKWDIYSYTVNRDAYTGMVLECRSRRYGNVILKIYPPFFKKRYIKETYVISHLSGYPQALLIDIDEQSNAFLLDRVIPGDYISFAEDRNEIISMFRNIERNRVVAESCDNRPSEIKSIIDQTKDELVLAMQHDYHKELLAECVKTADQIYTDSFAHDTKYLLHGDAYYKNALRSTDGIQVIDPVGYIDSFIFEYMPFLTYELVMHTKPEEQLVRYGELKAFFSGFTDVSKFDEATYVFLVKQLVPSIFEANDGYKRADRFIDLIRRLFSSIELITSEGHSVKDMLKYRD